MAEVILLPIGICLLIGFAQNNTPEAKAKRQQAMIERMKKMGEKRRYINKFIYEIPELSFYEAEQLKSKLGDIYEQWNDE